MSVLTVYFLSFHDLLDGLHDGLFASLKSKFGSSFDALVIVTSLLNVLAVGFLSMFHGVWASEGAAAYLEIIIGEGGRLNTIGELKNEVGRQVGDPLELAGSLLEVDLRGIGLFKRSKLPERSLSVPRERLATVEVKFLYIGAETHVNQCLKRSNVFCAFLLA